MALSCLCLHPLQGCHIRQETENSTCLCVCHRHSIRSIIFHSLASTTFSYSKTTTVIFINMKKSGRMRIGRYILLCGLRHILGFLVPWDKKACRFPTLKLNTRLAKLSKCYVSSINPLFQYWFKFWLQQNDQTFIKSHLTWTPHVSGNGCSSLHFQIRNTSTESLRDLHTFLWIRIMN